MAGGTGDGMEWTRSYRSLGLSSWVFGRVPKPTVDFLRSGFPGEH